MSYAAAPNRTLIVVCHGAARLSAVTLRALTALAMSASVQMVPMALVKREHDRDMDAARLDAVLEDLKCNLRLPDFTKDIIKEQRVQRLSALERVQLQRHEPRIKPHNPRVTGADIRKFIPRRV